MNIIQEIEQKYNLKNIDYVSGGYIYETEQITLFYNVLNEIKSQSPSMIELGSFECYYSIVFNKFFSTNGIKAKNICVEIDTENYHTGCKNISNNSCENFFTENAALGVINHGIYNGKPQFDGKTINTETRTVKELFTKYNIEKLDILHVDVQGSEADIVAEIEREKLQIDYCFVNIHDDIATRNFYGYSIYDKCKSLFNSMNVQYLYDHRTCGGYGDGLIVAKLNR
jgi:FkbM family methyltransferase